jgi:hypothetical protein
MGCISLLCTDMLLPFFFALYFIIYRAVDKHLGHIRIVPYILKLSTIALGLYLILVGCTQSLVGTSLKKHGPNEVTEGLGSVFVIILGVAIMMLPLYSKYVRFSKNE